VYTWQDQRLRLVAACASLYTFKPFKPLRPFTVSILLFIISQAFSYSRNTLSSSSTTSTLEPWLLKDMLFTLWSPLPYDSNAHCWSRVIKFFEESKPFVLDARLCCCCVFGGIWVVLYVIHSFVESKADVF